MEIVKGLLKQIVKVLRVSLRAYINIRQQPSPKQLQ
jgi:hypothetical protein